jgi:hypothetical protein
LSLAPFAFPVLSGYSETFPSLGSSAQLTTMSLLQFVQGILLTPCVLSVGLLWLAWRKRGDTPSGNDVLPTLLIWGLFFPLLFALHLRISSRLFIPILPMGLLWASSHLATSRWLEWRGRQRWLTFTGLAIVFLTGVFTAIQILSEYKNDLWRQYAEQTHFYSDPASQERLLLVRSYRVFTIGYELSNSRKHWRFYQDAQDGLGWYHHGQTRVSALPDQPEVRHLEQAFEQSPEFDLLWSRRQSHPFLKPVQTWLNKHCRSLIITDSWLGQSGIVYRCVSTPNRDTHQK